MRALADGWHETEAELRPGQRYRFALDGVPIPDPASRLQPEGALGWSEVVDLGFEWRCHGWRGRPWQETVLYELHLGTFSAAGTFLGAIPHLDHLVRLGVTTVELMPVGTVPGARNWGYDPVLPFAPAATYGTPAELQRLVDECHLRGLSIVLDVVLNHFGPLASPLADHVRPFFTDRHKTPWGPAFAFDGARAPAVRAFVVENALQWLIDYRFDGLRLDAVQAMVDDGAPHILDEIAERARAAAPGREIHLTLENDLNEARWLEGGRYDGQWNDDFHHTSRVLLAGETDGYYVDYADDPIGHLGRVLMEGFSYQGQESTHRPGMFRGTPSAHLPPTAFVAFLQNHDQVGNAPFGKRLSALAPPEAVRLGTALLLLAPSIPMLFMGQEWAASTAFDYFADYTGELADAIRHGRREEFRRFDAFQDEAALDALADPIDPATMAHSALDWSELGREPHASTLRLHTQLLALRREHVVPLLAELRAVRAVRLGPRALEASWATPTRRLVIALNASDAPLPYTPPTAPAYMLTQAQGVLPGWGLALCIEPRS